MANHFEFEAQSRATSGTSAARRMRLQEDRIPAVLYGAGKPTVSISLPHNFVLRALEHEAVFSHILTLKTGSESEKVVIKAVGRHPVQPRILHMDFLRINMSEKLVMRVPLHFHGEDKSQGLKDGGVMLKLMADLEISCLPDQLPEFITVDISALNMHESIHLSAIQLPEGVSLAHPIVDEEHDQQVVSIHEPRAEEVDEAPAVAADAVPTNAEVAAGEEAAAEGAEDKKPEAKKSEAKKPESKK